MRKCRFCAKDIQNASTVCEHCGRDLIPGRVSAAPTPDDVLNELEQARPPAPSARVDAPGPSGRALLAPEYAKAAATVDPVRVSVVDFDMPFGSMIVFILKWAMAAIPALLILAFLGVMVAAFLTGLIAAMAGSRRAGTDSPAAVEAPIVWTRARQLRGFSYAQVIRAIGQPSSQEPGVLIYRAANGDVLRLLLENDRVTTADPSDFDLKTIARPR